MVFLPAGEEAERDGHGDQGGHHQRAGPGLNATGRASTGACVGAAAPFCVSFQAACQAHAQARLLRQWE